MLLLFGITQKPPVRCASWRTGPEVYRRDHGEITIYHTSTKVYSRLP